MDPYSDIKKKLKKTRRICPKCGKQTIVFDVDRIYCKNCGFEQKFKR